MQRSVSVGIAYWWGARDAGWNPTLPPLRTMSDLRTSTRYRVSVSASFVRDWRSHCALSNDKYIHDIRLIERKGGSKKAVKGGANGNGGGLEPKFDLLTDNGNWKLIFTTGDMKTQKKIGGKISYVPIKAVQVRGTNCNCTDKAWFRYLMPLHQNADSSILPLLSD